MSLLLAASLLCGVPSLSDAPTYTLTEIGQHEIGYTTYTFVSESDAEEITLSEDYISDFMVVGMDCVFLIDESEEDIFDGILGVYPVY
ncbi:hypothetical protein CHH59_12530 [Shouchella clausii]|uniref:hypothetical protein n=1 Tax=Shouchella clausii TaxID=79880 RepID=UPI000BA747A2|nr:hypothetical protein [Shouchella clausii]PAF13668.1 hypothetical protein CHH59_12530 [Shouchella clausii]